MKRRWKILIVAGVFLLLLAASLLVTMHVQPANELEAYKKLLRAKGEKLEISEVLPVPVAPEDNSAQAVEDAFRMFDPGFNFFNIPNTMIMVARGKATAGWRQPDARGWNFTNSWDEFGDAIAADGPAMELLHQVLERPKLDFQLDYRGNIALPHLASMKIAAGKLAAATLFDLHRGDTGAAATNIMVLLMLVHNNTSETMLVSYSTRRSMTSFAVPMTWELLQATNADDGQFAAVQKTWQQMDFLSDAENSFVMDRAWSSAELQKARMAHEMFQKLSDPTYGLGSAVSTPSGWKSMLEGARHAVGEAMWRSSWSYSDELHLLRSAQAVLEAARAMQTNQSRCYKADYDAMSARLVLLGVTNDRQALFRTLNIPDFHEELGEYGFPSHELRMTLPIEAARRIVVTAVALKRFQLKHAKWPETLSELTPEYLASVPIDPYDGKPLKYRPATDGTFLLYSVAEDGVDNGGDPTNTAVGSSILNWQNPKARDWVWPQPATPAEVQDFYEHPPK